MSRRWLARSRPSTSFAERCVNKQPRYDQQVSGRTGAILDPEKGFWQRRGQSCMNKGCLPFQEQTGLVLGASRARRKRKRCQGRSVCCWNKAATFASHVTISVTFPSQIPLRGGSGRRIRGLRQPQGAQSLPPRRAFLCLLPQLARLTFTPASPHLRTDRTSGLPSWLSTTNRRSARIVG
jgi:hypothetical protein